MNEHDQKPEGNEPPVFSYADLLAQQKMDAQHVDELTAWEVAHGVKEIRDDIAERQAYITELDEKGGIIAGAKKRLAKNGLPYLEKHAEITEDAIVKELGTLRRLDSYPPAQRFIRDSIERAQDGGFVEAAEELTAYYSLSPEDKLHTRVTSTVSNAVARVALVLADEEPNAKAYVTLGEGGGKGDYNPYVRASAGRGAQGESGVDMERVKSLCKILGLDVDESAFEDLKERGHFTIGMPERKPRVVEQEIEDMRLKFDVVFNRERVKNGPEAEQMYFPESVVLVAQRS